MNVFTDATEEILAGIAKHPEAVAEVRRQMDEDDRVYAAARVDGFSDESARELVDSLGQMREARREVDGVC